MKKKFNILAVLLLVFTIIVSCVSCDIFTGGSGDGEKTKLVDYASSIELNMSSSTAKQEVTVKTYIDGDTTHFYVPTHVNDSGVLKARYIAINTPESTGKVEEWGKKASDFTKSKLNGASSIIIESDTSEWNADSTGDRYLVWVWYRNSESEKYRNLNIEILQEGLAIASNSGQNIYGQTALDALAQARANKLHVFSNEQDPDYHYGKPIEIELSDLRANIELYDGAKVAFNAVVARYSSNGVFVEAYDEETDMYNGMYVYYGFNLSALGIKLISTVGNEVRIVGTVSYYEAGDSYQVSGLSYNPREPENVDNLKLISENNPISYRETTAEKFTSKVNANVLDDGEEVIKELDYAKLALGSSISMKNLTVTDVYTTTNEDSSSLGAMTLTCKAGDVTVYVRTVVLKDADGNLITEEYFMGKTLEVKGIVDSFDGEYQIKLFSLNDVTIK